MGLARVVPLRRRDRELTAAPGARGTLPRERAPFDPEIEPDDTSSGNRPPAWNCAQRRHAPLRRRRIPGPRDERAADPSRRNSTAVLLTGVAGAGLATVAALALLASILNPSSRSLRGRVAARWRECGRARANQTGGALGQCQPIRRESRARHADTTRTALPVPITHIRNRPGPGRPAPARQLGRRQHRAISPRSSPHTRTDLRHRAAATLRPTRGASPSRTRRPRPSRPRRLSSRRARRNRARARLRPPIDQILESRAS